MEKDLQVVGFRIGNETYGVRIGAVREIVRVPEITSVPSAPDEIEGVINLRGNVGVGDNGGNFKAGVGLPF